MTSNSAKIKALKGQIAKLQRNLESLEQTQLTSAKTFNFDDYPRRKIALLFSYEGWHYCGLAFQNAPTPLPTVEQKILEALAKTRLIDPSQPPSSFEFSRCGRTDRGVSSSSQVISLWVRSALHPDELLGTGAVGPGLPIPRPPPFQGSAVPYFSRNPPPAPLVAQSSATKQEHDYSRILNRILPPSIRILAWSPVAGQFDARFSCLGRHYKYFFTSRPGQELDVQRMQEACQLLVGEHDFRNFCKIDPSKQINNFRREITAAYIEELPSNNPLERYYAFNLCGSAFLYHQVRHTVALLFLIGSGLEDPALISELLDVGRCPTKPEYEMAHELPLLLWQCEFEEHALAWQKHPQADTAIRDQLEEPLVQQTIRDHLWQAQRRLPRLPPSQEPVSSSSVVIQLGASSRIRVAAANYKSVLARPRGEHYETINARWLASKEAK